MHCHCMRRLWDLGGYALALMHTFACKHCMHAKIHCRHARMQCMHAMHALQACNDALHARRMHCKSIHAMTVHACICRIIIIYIGMI